jgi:F0F1-type ATP synthase membrane subunit c/vacuolar-type H+-ATPase subunit K
MEPDSDLKKVFRTTVIINGALVACLFLYALLVELVKFQLKPFPGLLVSGLRHQTLRYLFFGAAVGAVVFVRLAGRALHKMTPGEDLHHTIPRLSRTAVITSALGELPALLGFVLFLLTGFSRDFYVLLFVSLFLEFMYFPRLKAWQDLIGERFPQRGI